MLAGSDLAYRKLRDVISPHLLLRKLSQESLRERLLQPGWQNPKQVLSLVPASQQRC